MEDPVEGIRGAAVVLACRELEANLAFFTDRLGFRLESIFPADRPEMAVVEGFGVRLRLEVGPEGAAGTLRLACEAGQGGELTAPNGLRVLLTPDERDVHVPSPVPTFVLARADAASWHDGRAGMRYRDLVPDRQGGWLIASHIAIARGGPVPDYVHYHRVRFQMIFCRTGWVRVVYEDQGAPITMQPGDCVLQPPGIRHRVLECSDRLEVVELTLPAQHTTYADHELELPTVRVRARRRFEGQCFLFDRAATAHWRPWPSEGVEVREVDMRGATGGLAEVRVLRGLRADCADAAPGAASADLRFLFVLEGQPLLRAAAEPDARLGAGDAVTIPPGHRAWLAAGEGDEILMVTLTIGP